MIGETAALTAPRNLTRYPDTPGGRRQGRWHFADPFVALALVTAFFVGPLKLLGTSWPTYVGADGLALLVLFVVFAERISRRKPLFAASPLTLPLLLLACYCVLQLANPEAPFIRSVLGLRSWVLYLGFYFVGLYALRHVQQLERLYVLLLTLGCLTALYGVLQWRAGPQAFASWSEYYGRYAELAWLAESGAVFRSFSTFVTPGAFGGNMALLMLLAFGAAVSPRIRTRWRLFAAMTFAIMGVGIAASGSRGAVAHLVLAAAVGIGFTPGISRKVRAVFTATAFAAVASAFVVFLIGPVVGQRFFTILDPEAFFWKWFGPLTNGVRLALVHPFGMGLGYTAGVPKFIASPAIRELSTANIDSGYGSAAAELGFLGLAVFMFVAIKVGFESFRTWKNLPAGRVRDLFLGPALLGATYPMVSVVFQPQAALPSSIYFWLLLGMLMKASHLHEAGR